MNIRIANNENDSISASYIHAMGWKSGFRGIFSDRFLSEIPLDFWVGAFNKNNETRRFELAIMNDGDEDIGAGSYGLSRDYPDSDTGEITSLHFIDKAWGKGYSKQLTDYMITELREMGYKRIHVWALKDNLRARRFYEKCGFTLTENEKTLTLKGEQAIDVEYMLTPSQKE